MIVEESQQTSDDKRAFLQQMANQGHMHQSLLEGKVKAESIQNDARMNLVQTLIDSGDSAEALEMAVAIYDREPQDSNRQLLLARCCHATGDYERSHDLMEELLGRGAADSNTTLMLGSYHLSRGEFEVALDCLFKAEQSNPERPEVHSFIGDVYAKQEKWEQAENAYRKAIALQNSVPGFHLGLARCLIALQRYKDATGACLEAVSLKHDLPEAHFHLGVSLAKSGFLRRAITAMETSLEQKPELLDTRQWLAKLYELVLKQEAGPSNEQPQ